MRILGLDPGLARVGYGVIEVDGRPGSGRQLQVSLQAAGIAAEVFVGAELQRVHEHAHQHLGLVSVAAPAGPRDQALVAAVEGPHGGHEMQWSGPAAGQPLAQFSPGSQQLHG